jgi:UDP-2,4-diacetamido-2,4,6-trideoxy-beta-L-altropyranose hydrolase
MRILFRTDANAQIGTGHLMRCLALADVLRAEGAECTFLCRSAGLGTLAGKITDAGHALLALPEAAAIDAGSDPPQLAHAKWLPGGWRNDYAACLAKLEGQSVADWLIVDHYALDSRWGKAMRVAAVRIMVIDDLADRDHDCELLLDQNLVAELETRYANRVPKDCTCLLGPRYALLRTEFAALREKALARVQPIQAERVLVMFGGADPGDLTGATIDMLVTLGFSGHVDVVAGPLYQPLEALRTRLSSLPAARLHVQPPDIGKLMAQADLAIGSPGVTSWERCVLGLPTLAISVADNQEPIGKALAQVGGHSYLGHLEKLALPQLALAIRSLLDDKAMRESLGKASQSLCDGYGAERVCGVMLRAGSM